MCRSCIWGSKLHLVKGRTVLQLHLPELLSEGLSCLPLKGVKHKPSHCSPEILDGEEEGGLDDLNVQSTSHIPQGQKQLVRESFPSERNIFPPLSPLS